MIKFNFILIIVVLLMCGCKRFPDIGKGYKLDYNSRGDLGIVDTKGTYVIYGHILNYSYNEQFILIAERPRDSVPECVYLKGENYTDCNEAFEKSTFRQYWIVDKITNSLSGPLGKDQYLQRREQLGVPERLELKAN